MEILLTLENIKRKEIKMINRDHIGIFGKMNAGKSCIMNLLTQQETSIVDNTPGTTADTKITLQEIHGLGPVKLFDTAGLDEENVIGEKKRKKVLSTLKECDLALLVINPAIKNIEIEKTLIEEARELDKQVIIIYNVFPNVETQHLASKLPDKVETQHLASKLPDKVETQHLASNKQNNECDITELESKLPILKFYNKKTMTAIDTENRQSLLNFILKHYTSKNIKLDLLPFIEKDEFYILNIPMDDETPPGRYLRPQLMCEEYITRNWAYPVSYRMNLIKARNNDNAEKQRFNDFVNNFKKRPKVIITDSQAMDIMKDWTPKDIQLTTFSIMMINYMSSGRLSDFVSGVKHLDSLKTGDKVLIVEACNHSRVGEDIGTVQIPNYFRKNYPGVIVEHNFGREFQENKKISEYKLIIHCGGCMITQQKLSARIRDLASLGIPYTNYGVFLSYIHGKQSLERVLKVWN
jgi:small GTP-binding protein